MNLKEFGQNVRFLRRESNISQEELAAALGVSYQAVSKWERGESLPDIAMAPQIAIYFNVTLDELFGMEQERRNKSIAEIQEKSDKIMKEQGSAASIEFLKGVIHEYPYAHNLWLQYGYRLGGLEIIGDAPTNEQMHEAIAVFEKIISRKAPEYFTTRAIHGISYIYHKFGDDKKAIEYAEKLPSEILTKEAIVTSYLHGEEQISAIQKQLKRYISQFLSITRFAGMTDIYDYHISDPNVFGYSAEERIKILEKGIEVAKLFTDDGDWHFQPIRISVNYRSMAVLACTIGQYDQALDYIEKSAEFALEDGRLKKSGKKNKHKSVLLNRHNVITEGWAVADMLNWLNRNCSSTGSSALQPIRDHERFVAVVERLRSSL
ncbi:MAG: helix-turn-helix domain-containing protein [Oscillospiraceae bacterium]|nr:helix-turn-helix domain-containing protein [Oscillospiraceae bacterium]